MKLEALFVNNFRLFRDLSIKRLGRVNLVVGKNNSGKSALLEAVRIYASNASPSLLLDLVESRQESWTGESQATSPSLFSSPLRHLFYGHSLPKPGTQGIIVGEPNLSNSFIHITTAAFRHESQIDGTITRIRVPEDDIEGSLEDLEIYLIAEEKDRTRRLVRLDGDVRRQIRLAVERSEPRIPTQTVPTENMQNRTIAALWDLTSLTDLEEDVISGLQLIESRITGIAFVEDILRRSARITERIPLVKIRGISEPLPLKSMGDGMTRLFHIIVALVNAKNGILLIDEFENGLHWSIQPRVWSIVFQLAKRLNVQVFATTHSRDCVRSFGAAWDQHASDGAFFRLDTRVDEVKAVAYNLETLTDALDTNVEVR